MPYSTQLDAALALAADLHRTQTRKGSDIPYLTHLLAVAGFVGEFGGGEDEMIAAALHDAPEDQGGLETMNRIRSEFGDRVATIVEGCSERFDTPKPSWQDRKAEFIERFRSADHSVMLVVGADKLHNASTIIRDLRRFGDDIWDRFTGKRDGTLWYYGEIVQTIVDSEHHPDLSTELELVIQQMQT